MDKQNYSNPFSRIMASAIDGVICGTPYLIAAFSSNKFISILLLVVTATIAIYNFYYLMAKKRATIGMQLMEMEMFKFENEKISEIPFSYSYLILRNIISGILSDITYGIEFITIFFTKKKQTLHDIIFKSVFVNNPPRKKYLIALSIVVVAALVGFASQNYFFERHNIITYKINDKIDKLDAYRVLSDNLKGVIPEDKFIYKESSHEISIILPIGLDKKIVKEKVSKGTNSLNFMEQTNGEWTNSEISNSDIEYARLSFGADDKPNVLIKFKPEKAAALQNFTERNLNKEVKITIENQEIFSGTISEKITGGEMVFSKDSVSTVNDILAKINLGSSNSLTLISDSGSRRLLKDTFVWIKK